MSDILTMAEIHSQFDSEWVLVGDPDTDESLQVHGGNVIYHSKDRDEVYRKPLSYDPSGSRCFTPEPFPKTPQLFYEFRLRSSPGTYPRASGDTWSIRKRRASIGT